MELMLLLRGVDVGADGIILKWIYDACGGTQIAQGGYQSLFFQWLYLPFAFTSTILSMGQYIENLRKDYNYN